MSRVSDVPAVDDDAWLCRRVAEGEAAAERELVQRFSGRLMAMAVWRTRDVEAARELVDDVLMATVTALRRGSMRETERLSGFVHGIAVNLINNYLRSRCRRPVLEPLPDDLVGIDGSERFELEADLQAMRRCVLELSEVDRMILMLTLVDGLDQSEIAARTGLSVDAVKQRRNRALKRMKEMLGEASPRGSIRPLGRW